MAPPPTQAPKRRAARGMGRRSLNQLSRLPILASFAVWLHFPSPHPRAPRQAFQVRLGRHRGERRTSLSLCSSRRVSIHPTHPFCRDTYPHLHSPGTRPWGGHKSQAASVGQSCDSTALRPPDPGMALWEDTGGMCEGHSSVLCLFPGFSGKIRFSSLGFHAQGQCERGAILQPSRACLVEAPGHLQPPPPSLDFLAMRT